MPLPRWILLIHSLPPKPLYLRAKVRNRLERVGALPLKNSVYVLPHGADCLEDLQWIAQEAVAGGGGAWVVEAGFVFGLTAEELEERFRRARASDFEALSQEIRAALRTLGKRKSASSPPDELVSRSARLEKRYQEIAAIDFFGTPERHAAEMALGSLIDRLRPSGRREGTKAVTSHASYAGRTWTTRSGVHIDRIASAWLIRRFIDPKARFRFLTASAVGPGEIGFDMVGGEFTHEGDRCTFETLMARFGIGDPALEQIAQIVHDVDLKDGKFGRVDAPGVQQLIQGLVMSQPDDEVRLERGAALFDDLYRSFGKGVAPKAANGRRRSRRKTRP